MSLISKPVHTQPLGHLEECFVSSGRFNPPYPSQMQCHRIRGHFRNLNWRSIYKVYVRAMWGDIQTWCYIVPYLQFRYLKWPLINSKSIVLFLEHFFLYPPNHFGQLIFGSATVTPSLLILKSTTFLVPQFLNRSNTKPRLRLVCGHVISGSLNNLNSMLLNS